MLELPGYRLTQTIYESENSRVFRGRALHDDRPVIVKTPTSEHPSPKQLARWRYEFDLLKGIDLGSGRIGHIGMHRQRHAQSLRFFVERVE